MIKNITWNVTQTSILHWGLAEISFIYIAISFVNGSSIWIFSGSGLNQQHQLHLYIWFIHSFWRVVECGKCFRLHYYVDLFDVCQIWQKIKRITVRYMFDWISNANYRKYILKIVFNIYAMTLVNGFEVPIWDWKQQKINITWKQIFNKELSTD